MKLFSLRENGFPKTLLILVVVLLVASGLCGIQWELADKLPGGPAPIIIPLGVVELIVIALSAGGFIVVLVMWIGTVLLARFGKPREDEVQKPFGSLEKTKHEDER
jgi:hypothetical protein